MIIDTNTLVWPHHTAPPHSLLGELSSKVLAQKLEKCLPRAKVGCLCRYVTLKISAVASHRHLPPNHITWQGVTGERTGELLTICCWQNGTLPGFSGMHLFCQQTVP